MGCLGEHQHVGCLQELGSLGAAGARGAGLALSWLAAVTLLMTSAIAAADNGHTAELPAPQ